jgi:hypothetical protein
VTRAIRSSPSLDLPTGQVSWHLPDGAVPHWWPRYGDCWDGHSRAAKQARIRAYLATQATV